MREAPAQRPELHHGDEARQVQHLPLQVLAVADAAQIEELGACAATQPDSLPGIPDAVHP